MDLAFAVFLQVAIGVATLLLISLGLALIFGMMRVINLAHDEFLMLGAYSAIISVRAGLNIWLAMLVIAPIVVGVIGGGGRARADPRALRARHAGWADRRSDCTADAYRVGRHSPGCQPEPYSRHDRDAAVLIIPRGILPAVSGVASGAVARLGWRGAGR